VQEGWDVLPNGSAGGLADPCGESRHHAADQRSTRRGVCPDVRRAGPGAALHQRDHQRDRVDSSDLLRRMRQERHERAAQEHC
jgi:hypothetical protein